MSDYINTEVELNTDVNNTAETENNNTEEIPKPERTKEELEEAIEAILFAAGHPITYATLARVFELTPSKIKDIVFDYSMKYNDSPISRGVILLTYADSCQLCTKKNYLPEIREALGIRKSGTLSTSSMEALAIVAYNQPVTRLFVDTLRRADSSYAMNNLIDRGLIECKGRLDVPGRPMLYGTTSDFLRSFGLKDLDSLPATTEELIEAFENAKVDVETQTVDLEKANEGLLNETTATQSSIDDIVTNDGSTDTNDSNAETTDSYEEASAEDDTANY